MILVVWVGENKLKTEGTPQNPYDTNAGHEKFLTIGKKQSVDFFNQLQVETNQIQDHLAKTEILEGSPLKRLHSPADPKARYIPKLT